MAVEVDSEVAVVEVDEVEGLEVGEEEASEEEEVAAEEDSEVADNLPMLFWSDGLIPVFCDIKRKMLLCPGAWNVEHGEKWTAFFFTFPLP